MNLQDLNPEQQKAVLQTEGPVLILAGAGSGKTRVLTHRVAYLVGEKQVRPWNILAITFTNKAAGEMRQRVDKLVGAGSESVWVSTFHSTCVRILRRHISPLGYDEKFTIYDTDDQKTLMKGLLKELEVDTKQYKERMFLSKISAAKNELIGPENYLLANSGPGEALIAKVYQAYQKRLQECNALDFDDLIFMTVKLFEEYPEILENYQERFRYIMVDEYQDTNTAQFQLISLLAKKYRNLCVVGDDDQSIYKFRGANIRNILNFEKHYPEAVVLKLEQNYRSTGYILKAANAVIANNFGRKDKALWTEKEEGSPLLVKEVERDYEEAEFIASEIEKNVEEGAKYQDFAILYRTNAQSRVLEEKLILSNIPYRIIGGVNFYSRMEIKDLLAYLKTIDNGRDDLMAQRIINVPKRGIGTVTVGKVQAFAAEREISFFEALGRANEIPSIGKAAEKLQAFYDSIMVFRSKQEFLSLTELLKDIIETTGYVALLEEENTDEARSRIENIDELISKVQTYEDTAQEPTLSGFLEEVSLVADVADLTEGEDYVVLMTLHSAKGLEFSQVFMPGMEEGLFPGYLTISSGIEDDMEEERRLCYVGITRAMNRLTMTYSKSRMLRGEVQYNRPSRFLREIPEEYKISEEYKIPGGFKISGEFKSSEENKKAEEYKNVRTQGSRLHNTASEAWKSFRQKPFSQPKSFGAAPLTELDYGEGDRVLHMKFGEGKVRSIIKGGKDFEVTVDFDGAGTKKMFASFARLKKI